MNHRIRSIVLILMGLIALVLGCDLNVDVGAAARSSITSFFNTLATTAITNAVNPTD